MDLEGIVSKLSDRFKVKAKHRQLGLEFLADRLDWLVRHKEVYPTLTEQIVEDELQYFYHMRGAIPIITAEGPKRILTVSDLYLLRPFEIGVVNKKGEKRYDTELFRLDRRISARDGKENGPSRGELVDQFGQTRQLRSYFHRPVSYDDVLPVWEVMQRYQTGQRAVTVRIRSRSMQMTVGTQDDLWVLNPTFIKLRISGKLVNDRLYYFWRRVENGKNDTEKDSADGSDQWSALFNHEGRDMRVVTYLGTAATWEAVALNPKAKLIKFGQLPSSELVKLGVLDMPGGMKRKESEIPEGEYRSPDSELTQAPPIISSYEELSKQFGGYVPIDQIAGVVFEAKIKELLSTRPVSQYEAFELARTLGVKSPKGVTIETAAKKIMAKIPRIDTIRKLQKPAEEIESGEEIENTPSYYILKGTEPVRQVLYGALVQATKELNPEYGVHAERQLVSGVITVLKERGIENKGDLEELLKEGWGAIKAVRGLVNVVPSNAHRLAGFLRACQIIGYDVPLEAVTASSLKYMGKDSKLVKDAFSPYVKQAVIEINPQFFGTSFVNQSTGRLIHSVLEGNGIVFMSQLEELLQKGNEAILGLKGLVAKVPSRKHALYDYFVRACELAGYKIGNGAAAAIASVPAPAAQATS